VGLLLYAQEPVRFGDREVYLEANVRPKVRGHKTSSLELGNPSGEKLNVLVQFASGKIAYEALKQKGVELGDYLGSNAYYAKVAPGSRPGDFVGTGMRSVVPIRGEWKVVHSLLQDEKPDWAVEGENLKVDLLWFSDIDPELIKADLRKRGVTFSLSSDLFRTAHVTATREQLLALAEFTDYLDGYYARKRDEVSDFGKIYRRRTHCGGGIYGVGGANAKSPFCGMKFDKSKSADLAALFQILGLNLSGALYFLRENTRLGRSSNLLRE